MTTTFQEATAITRTSEGAYDVVLRDEYAIGGTKPNGGYLLATMGRAAIAAAQEAGATQQHVIAAGAQFLASPDNGPAVVTTEVLRVGRTATQVEARVANGDRVGVVAKFTLGNLPEGGTPYWGGVDPVNIAPFDTCKGSPMAGERGIDLVFDPETTFSMVGGEMTVTGGGEFRAWISNAETGSFDTLGLLFASDALPPATFGVVMNGWVPTLDITTYVRAIPAPGPLSMRFRVQMIQDGFADEICEAWDAEGRLVMQSTQMAALRLPA